MSLKILFFFMLDDNYFYFFMLLKMEKCKSFSLTFSSEGQALWHEGLSSPGGSQGTKTIYKAS